MKPLIRCFGIFLRQISKDGMLYATLVAPILAGAAFRFGIPAAETALCAHFGKPAILSQYYLLFDLFLVTITPYMLCFVSALVILTEYDENMSSYMAVTPVGKRGYIASRLVLPAIIAVFVSFILMKFFSLTSWAASALLIICVLSSLLNVGVSLLIVSFSHNRVEGMALGKLAGIILMGLPVPFFMFSGVQYLFSLLPSFWIAKISVENNYLFVIPALLTSFIWIRILYGRFANKLS